MHELALGPLRTEAGQVVDAQYTPDVSVPTIWSVPAESAVVPRTIFDLALGVDVQEGALFVVARVEARVKVAFGHFCHVEFVQELALVAFFAEAPEPMFANNRPISADVTEGARVAFVAAIEAVY